MSAKIPLNELSRHSAWPARLLGLTDWKKRIIDHADVMREYDREKWGVLLSRLEGEAAGAGLDDVERWENEGYGDVLCSSGDELALMSLDEAKARHLDLVRGAVAPHLPASALVELGAGYGAVFLRLAARKEFAGMPLFAADLAPSGVALLERLARTSGLAVRCGACDLASDAITDLPIPRGALIYTSYAVPYAPRLTQAFVDGLSRLRPKAVVHVEPVFEHAGSNLLGLLRQSYIRMNDYNVNLLSILKEAEAMGRIEILEETPEAFGFQALLTPSVVSWRPVGGNL